jgi:hypothetical protein
MVRREKTVAVNLSVTPVPLNPINRGHNSSVDTHFSFIHLRVVQVQLEISNIALPVARASGTEKPEYNTSHQKAIHTYREALFKNTGYTFAYLDSHL